MRIALILSLVIMASVAACAAGDQAYLGMFAETSLMQIAGMPEVPPMPPGTDIPGMEAMMSLGKPVRSFTVRLWSPGIAPDGATAGIVPPAGLKQGARLDLEIYRPEAAGSSGGEGGEGQAGGKTPDFTIKYYWGSSASVKPGQPKVFSSKSMSAEAKQRVEKEREAARGGASYLYKPDWTTAYWPTKKQPGKIAKDASLVGAYSLTTSYCGSVELECPPTVDFLAPIEMTAPKLAEESPDLSQAMAFQWKPIPNLLGSHAVITGMQGEDTLIIWVSSEVWRDEIMSVDWGYLQMAEVQKYVKDKIMMPGEQMRAVVPQGIFKDCDFVSMAMTGYGPGAARMDTRPLPRIQTKTTLTLQLGGKAVGEMGFEDN